MSGLWKVDRFSDSVRAVKRRAINPAWAARPQLEDHYFDTEAEANAFVVARAERRVRAAEDEVRKERARLARVRKKYGTA